MQVHPPEAWSRGRGAAQRAFFPVERLLAREASSGVVLLIATVVALALANSPLSGAYEALWHFPVGLRFGDVQFERSLHFWVNDGLMTLFFFVVGLEIRREIYQGELSELRRAALPLAAALGGMLAPAAIFAWLNQGRAGFQGWGVPMATDIAFAVGVLALLGHRVSAAQRILLLALAVVDDVGAIIVIALFYSSDLSWVSFLLSAVGLVVIWVQQLFGVRSPWAYVPAGGVIWAGIYGAGIHPTLAGVVVGAVTPVRAWYGPQGFLHYVRPHIAEIEEKASQADHALLPHLDRLERARREAVSPSLRLQHALHGWVTYGVMPVFAFANAGVSLGNAELTGDAWWLFWGVLLGLVLGKPLGVLTCSGLFERVGWAALPAGVGFSQVALVGAVAGIGFTMSLFIAQLAFPPGPLLETCKLAILIGSTAAGVIGLLMGRFVLAPRPDAGHAQTASEAEQSTER